MHIAHHKIDTRITHRLDSVPGECHILSAIYESEKQIDVVVVVVKTLFKNHTLA